MAEPDPTVPVPAGARTTRRRGRLSDAHRAAMAEHAPSWGLSGPDRWSRAGLVRAFGRDATRLLDVGVGNGDATLAWAAANPSCDVVAVEVHRPGLGRLYRALGSGAHPNVRIAEEDVTVVLAALDLGSFQRVRVLFPDPWPKRRHHERRLVDERFVHRLADVLPSGGDLHVATDWDDYAAQVRRVLAAEPRFDPVPDDSPDEEWSSARPERPVTVYEARGIAAGRRVTDLVARRL